MDKEEKQTIRSCSKHCQYLLELIDKKLDYVAKNKTNSDGEIIRNASNS